MHRTTFTLAEAAELLRCHKETLRRAILDGSLQAARLGRGYRISRADLQKFWTDHGGGELFGKTEAPVEPPAPAQEEAGKPAREKEKDQTPKGPQQLTLPTI